MTRRRRTPRLVDELTVRRVLGRAAERGCNCDAQLVQVADRLPGWPTFAVAHEVTCRVLP